MELDLNEFGKRYVTYTNYVFISILFLGIIFIILLFTASGETLGNVFEATQVIYGITLLFLPVGIILAIIKQTRKFGGAVLFTIAAVTLGYWWIAALLILFDKGGIWWSVVGVVLSLFTGGYGIFAVTIFSAIIHKSISGVFLFIGIPLISRFVLHLGKGLMEIHPEQVKQKIEEFEKKQQKELDELNEKIYRLEIDKKLKVREIEELDETITEIDEIEKNWNWQETELEDDEDWEDDYDDLTEEERQNLIKQLETELLETEKEVEKAQEEKRIAEEDLVNLFLEISGKDKESQNSPESPKTLAGLMQSDPVFEKAFYEVLEEKEIPEGTADFFGRDALLTWRKGNRELALELYNRSIGIEPNNAVELLNRGNLQIEMGRFEEGIADLEKAASIDSSLPTHLAPMLKIMNHEARESLRKHMIEKNSEESD